MSLLTDFPATREVSVHICGSCGRPHAAEYGAWCRAERQRLHPNNFARWTEAEHRAKRSSLTWDEQQTLWAHMDAWEGYFDGQISLVGVREYLAQLGPLPQPAMRIQRLAATAPAPAITREQEAQLMALAAAGRERARAAEAEFNRAQEDVA